MFFEKDLISFNILDVLEMKQKNVHMVNSGRNFDAISYRFHADTTLSSESETLHVGDDSVGFFPARLEYTRDANIDEMIVVHFDMSGYFSKRIEVFTPKEPERLRALFREILSVWEKKEVGYKYRSSALLYEIFAECYEENFDQSTLNPKIKSAVTYMNEHFKEASLSISEIAKRSFVSEVYFRKIFKEEYGISPQKYIIKMRIQHAVGLISSGYYSLKEIAYMSGYNDYKYFSVEFKRLVGVSPSEYLYNYKG